MPTRNVSLTDHFDRFVDQNVSSGQFNNASEVMRAALQLLEKSQQEEQARLSALRDAARVGFGDLDQRRYTELGSREAINNHLDRLAKRARSSSPAQRVA